jgi:hypothetical protein
VLASGLISSRETKEVTMGYAIPNSGTLAKQYNLGITFNSFKIAPSTLFDAVLQRQAICAG